MLPVGIPINSPISQCLIDEKLMTEFYQYKVLFTDLHLDMVVPKLSITVVEPLTRLGNFEGWVDV